MRLLAVFGLREHRIGVGEVHQTERVGIGYVGPNGHSATNLDARILWSLYRRKLTSTPK